MKLHRFNLAVAAFCLIALAFVGCKKESGSRPGLVKAEGVVTYNGELVVDAIIEMRPADEGGENCVAVGRTDEKGRFVMMTDRPGDGALPGRYKTVVKKQVEMIEGVTRDEYVKAHDPDGKGDFVFDKNKIQTEDLVPSKYSDPLNTPLEIEIPKKGDKNIEIALED